MRIVIADTSPLNYLVQIGSVEILSDLYARIVVPEAVIDELTAPGTPPEVAAWAKTPPVWLEILSSQTPVDLGVDADELDRGELTAIQLALALASGDEEILVLMDDAAGRSVASRLGIKTSGTLGVLIAGSRAGLLDLNTAVGKLRQTNFRASEAILRQVLDQSF